MKELWRLHLRSGVWHHIPTPGPIKPRATCSQSVVNYHGQVIVLLGTDLPWGIATEEDVYALTPRTGVWEKLPVTLAEPLQQPPRLFGQSAVLYKDAIYVFAGMCELYV
jgi:hypothetical protein